MGGCFPRRRPHRSARRSTVAVIGYSVTNASHDTSRDGSVTVRLDADENDAVEILWSSSGATATSRQLCGVRPGVYGAIVLTLNGSSVRCVHACDAARVHIEAAAGAEGASRTHALHEP